jgi:Ca2+-binding EF-hand superfamily protein
MKRFCMLTGIVLASSVAVLAEDGPKPNELFQKLDKNNDGKIVADEVSEDQARFFERLVRLGDADKNGELTESEFSKATSETADAPPASRNEAGPGRRPGDAAGRQFDAADFFKRLDKNGDGKVSKSELPEAFAERLAPAFEKLGKDAFTLEEFQQLRQQAESNGAGRPDGRPGQTGNPEETFKRLDANGDGKLTVDETPEQGRRMVAAILERSGKGRDGSLTLREFQTAMAQFNRGQQNARPEDGKRPDGDGDRKRPEGDRPSPDGDMRRPEQSDRPANGGPAFLRILDANQDGRLSREELEKAVSLLERLDQNQDGSLDMRELFGGPGPGQDSMDRPRQSGGRDSSDRPRRPETDPAEGQPEPKRASQRPQTDRERRPDAANLEENFGRMDRDKDGAISKEEATDRLKQNFDRIDTSKDGKVTLEELRKFLERSNRE